MAPHDLSSALLSVRRRFAPEARGRIPAPFERRCIPRGLCCSSVEYAQCAPSSRLATRAPHRFRRHAAFHHGLLVAAALALGVTFGVVAPAAANATDDAVSGVATDSAPDERSSASTARSAATVEESSDRGEILPGLTMGSQLRLRTESRRNARFDAAQPGNDEDYLLSRFRFDLAWEPSAWVTGIVELQDARILGEEAISETRTPNIFADRLDFH